MYQKYKNIIGKHIRKLVNVLEIENINDKYISKLVMYQKISKCFVNIIKRKYKW